MGRKKITIAKIQSKVARTVTFTKRRQGLFKKAAELCVLCDVDMTILTFSPSGRPFSFGNPSVDSLLTRFVFGGPTPLIDAATASSKPINGGYWWEAIDLGEFTEEGALRGAKVALEELKENVRRRLATLSCPDLANADGFCASYSLAGGGVASGVSCRSPLELLSSSECFQSSCLSWEDDHVEVVDPFSDLGTPASDSFLPSLFF